MAKGAADTSTAAAMLKDIWDPDSPKDACFKQYPMWGLVEKRNDYEGNGTLHVAVQIGQQQGVANTIAQAYSNASANVSKEFLVKRAKFYGIGRIQRELIIASKSNKGSLLRAMMNEQKGLEKQLVRMIGKQSWDSGSGVLGQSSTVTGVGAGAVITLADKAQVAWFEPNQTLTASATPTGAAKAIVGAGMVVLKRDPGAGTITLTQNVTTACPTWVDGDYLFRDGTMFSQLPNPVTGIAGWIPPVAPIGGDNFWGIDRSVDPTRLAGIRYDASATGENKLESLRSAMTQAQVETVAPDSAFYHPTDFNSLVKSIEGTPQWVTTQASGTIKVGYEGVKVLTPAGLVTCYPDPGVPKGFAWVLNLDDWCWEYLCRTDSFPELFDEDGELLRESQSDSYEWRAGGYAQMVCSDPHGQVVITL
jgi:hypothetical protein